MTYEIHHMLAIFCPGAAPVLEWQQRHVTIQIFCGEQTNKMLPVETEFFMKLLLKIDKRIVRCII